jgi:hypothetical protein
MSETNTSRNIRIRKPEEAPLINVGTAALAALVSPLQEEIAVLRQSNEKLTTALQTIAIGLFKLSESAALANYAEGSTRDVLGEFLFQASYVLGEALDGLALLDADLVPVATRILPARRSPSSNDNDEGEDRHILNISDM